MLGEWTKEATPLAVRRGRATAGHFEWLEAAPLLIQRWQLDVPEAPDGIAVIGCDGMSGTCYQRYTDERDVQRIHEMSLTDRVWELWRDCQPFSQRFTDFDLTDTKVG